MDINGKNIVITGSNKGIGYAFSKCVAKDKTHLILINRSDKDGLKEELLKLGALSVQIIKADLSLKSEVEKVIEQLKKMPVDILFNNAGLLTGGLLEKQSIDDIYKMLSVNVNTLIHMTHGILPQMLAQRSGKIINHASVSSIMNFPCASTYSAAKAAVLAFTRCLEAELKSSGVTTLSLITSGVETEMFHDIPNKYGNNLNLSFLKGIPADQYAVLIRKAILNDQTELTPSGASYIGLWFAHHFPKVFNKIVATQFKR